MKVGDIRTSNSYGQYEIVSRKPGLITIRFLTTGYVGEFPKGSVRLNSVKDPLCPNIHGVGFYGDGYFSSTLDQKIKMKAWETWESMLKRCYRKQVVTNPNHPYHNCSVSEEWHNFQIFCEFYCNDLYRKDGWELDKDLLFKGNKKYSPETCVFLPVDINGALKLNKSRRGELPIGVKKQHNRPGYAAVCRNVNGVQVSLGKFSSVEAAFLAYKEFKESVLKKKAEIWKDEISPVAYNALMNYRVEWDD